MIADRWKSLELTAATGHVYANFCQYLDSISSVIDSGWFKTTDIWPITRVVSRCVSSLPFNQITQLSGCGCINCYAHYLGAIGTSNRNRIHGCKLIN